MGMPNFGGGKGGAGDLGEQGGELFGSMLGDWLAQDDYTRAQNYRQQGLNAYDHVRNPTDFERVGRSEMDKVQADAQARAARRLAMERLQRVGLEGGMDAESQAALAQAQGQSQAYERGQREAILGDAASRGMLNSGMSSVMQAQAQQEGANRMAMTGTQAAADARRRALDALSQSENIAGGIERDAFGEGAERAKSNDAIAKFNAANSMDFNQNRFNNDLALGDRMHRGYRERGDDYQEQGQRTAEKYRGYGKGFGRIAGTVVGML